MAEDFVCRRSARIRRAGAGLLVIDIQERLLPAIHEKERVVANSRLLIEGMQIMGRPVIVTEQYRKGLGPTVREISTVVAGFSPIEKMAFSAAGTPRFDNALTKAALTDIVLCGIEAHVCVSQTCLDLRERGFRVFVTADAISSRVPENCRLGVERMRDAGGVIVSTEMIIFELLGCAGTAEFKQILPLVR